MNTSGKKTIDGTFFFEPEDSIYRDHFPGNPVVPGSVIVDSFLQAANKQTGKRDAPVIRNFKFRHFITPGRYEYSINIFSNMFTCKLYDGKILLVSGELDYGN